MGNRPFGLNCSPINKRKEKEAGKMGSVTYISLSTGLLKKQKQK